MKRLLFLVLLAAGLFPAFLWADEPAAADKGEKAANPAPFHAGFRKFKLTYRPPAAEADVERPVCLWYPITDEAPAYDYLGQRGFAKLDAEVAPGKHPLILFSHGFMGDAKQSIFITEELARRGYIVVGLNHADSLAMKRSKPLEMPDFGDPKKWNDTKFRDRHDDVVALLDRMLAINKQDDSFMRGHIDEKQIGGMGHSLGGYTMLGLVGGWPEWKDDRIQSALLLSPYVTPYIESGKLADVKTPVMLQGGTWDWGITPFLPSVYDRLTSPRYLLVLKKETHFGWTNLVSLEETTKECIAEGNPELICRYSTAFFDKTLRGEKRPELTADEPRLNKLVFEETVGKRK